MMDSPTTVFTSAPTQTSLYASTSPPKRKRRPAGNPDPDAEVVALSPKTLMESDRYVCEICNQGFQRDQNLQMHRRRHKVPWKLLKRVDPEVRKRVYVCPEPSCLHHNSCHALGDLVGIKKHYRRKHSSMKQWECDKCSKAYAVQSDYKAHVKTCGTRGHCCDCGRVFSRVESFIEHQDTCNAARNKKGSASSDLEAASLPSLAVSDTAYHPTIMPTNPSNFAEKVMKDNYHHNAPIMNFPLTPLHVNSQDRSSIPLRPLPPQISVSSISSSALAVNAHACIMIPAIAPPQISPASPSFPIVNATALPPHSPLSMATLHSQATQDGSISWEIQQPSIPHNHGFLQHHKAELQLLPTSKSHLNQLESSQSSVTWGKDINSTNSTTSGTCSSPASKTVDDKRADGLEMLHMSCAASTAADTPCMLQLSIGLSNNEHLTSCEKSRSLHVSRDLTNQEDKSETLDSKATRMPWLAWSASPLVQKREDSCNDVPNIAGVAKMHCSSCTSDGKQGITCGINACKDAIDLELVTGFDHLCGSVRLNQTGAENPRSSNVHHHSSLEDNVHQLQQRHDHFLSCSKTVGLEAAAGFTHQNSTKPSHSCMQDEEVIELLQVTERSCTWSLDSKGAEEAKLLRRNSTRESFAAPDVSDQLQTEQSNSLSGSIEEPGHVSELLQCAETPHFSLGTSMAQKLKFSLGRDKNVSAVAQAAEALLQKAREKLKKASADKLEAEKAWREARREREQAEEELAKAQRIAGYNRMIALGEGALVRHACAEEKVGTTRKPTCSSSTSSSPYNSIANSQASSSSLQIMQLHAGGVLCSTPSFITCPTCHHTSQILYPSPANNIGTLFLASPLELAPATTLNTTPHINLPSSPTSI